MKPKFDTDFDCDEWHEKMKEKDILDGYFGKKEEVEDDGSFLSNRLEM